EGIGNGASHGRAVAWRHARDPGPESARSVGRSVGRLPIRQYKQSERGLLGLGCVVDRHHVDVMPSVLQASHYLAPVPLAASQQPVTLFTVDATDGIRGKMRSGERQSLGLHS